MSENISGNLEFSKWRSYIWPVHRFELRKLIPMLLIFFLVSFDYNILHSMKDALVVTAKNSGAEVIPFIKVWAMLPSAVLVTYIFTRLSNRLSRDGIIYVILGAFLLFFLIFTFVLYPARDFLHPNDTADKLETLLPIGLHGFVAMFRNWTFTSFYVMSELWSNIILSLLFWGFANQVTRMHEAKRFYGLFGIGANISGVAAGQVSVFFCRNKTFNPHLPFGSDAWEQSMAILVLIVVAAGIVALGILWWLNNRLLKEPLFSHPSIEDESRVGKPKFSMRDNFANLFSSRYLICVAIIVISYNLVINLVEVLWKQQVRELYPDPSDFSVYMNQVITFIGIFATVFALFISGNSMRKFGWTFTAMLTPVILFITSIGFFFFFFIKGSALSDTMFAITGLTPLAMVVFFGSAQNVLSRAAKYSVFDATKEMAFVPLDYDLKIKGKAAIDGICSRLGKSGGSVIHQTLLITFSTMAASAPYVAATLLCIISVWLMATRVVGTKMAHLEPGAPVIKPDLNEQPIPQAS